MSYRKLIYLASPYSHPDENVVRTRVAQTQSAVARLIEEGNLIFSPIVHSDPIHHLVNFNPHNSEGELSEWLTYDKAFISKCDELWVLMLDGWADSNGITAEVRHAIDQGIRCRYLEYPSLQFSDFEFPAKAKPSNTINVEFKANTEVLDRAVARLERARKLAYQTEAVIDRINAKVEIATEEVREVDSGAMCWCLPDLSYTCGNHDGQGQTNPFSEPATCTVDRYIKDHPKPLKLIGLTGHAQSGKDTAGQYLVANHGFTRIGLADAVKEALYELNPNVPLMALEGHVPLLSYLAVGGWDKAKAENPEIRQLLQRMGTEVGRNIFGENCWIDIAQRKIEALGPDAKVVITDVRFPNEAEWIRSMGGEVWEIRRPGVGPVNDHASDQKLDASLLSTAIVNDGTVGEFYQALFREVHYINANAATV